MGAIISQHNKKILRGEPTPLRCRCLDKPNCPMPGKCATDKVVYRATVTTAEKTERRINTELSSYIWDLKDQNTPYEIRWDLVRRANPFSPVTRKCDLCIAEKLEIIYNPGLATLNKRNELYNHCRHRDKVLLVKRKRKKRIPGE